MQIDPVVFKIEQELRKKLPAQGRFLLAVSGGADSLALADACAALRSDDRRQFFVCHVEHGIRGAESLRDKEIVEAFCQSLQLPFYYRSVAAAEYAEAERLSLEEAARILRYAALRDVLRELNGDYLVTAHHRDDQAETVLFRMLRGSGMDGLSGMRVAEGDLLRPFLELPKSAPEEYCRLKKLPVCCDSTNADPTYTRNRIRGELLPYLEKNFNVNIKDALVRTAAILQEDGACLAEMAERGFAEAAQLADEEIILDVKRMAVLHPALQKRILRSAYFKMGGKELSYERTEALFKMLAAGRGGKVLQLPGGIRAGYADKKLRFIKI